MTDQPSFTCPICGRTTYNPEDVQWGYCVACAGCTREPAPPGFVWALMVGGGALDQCGRLIAVDHLEAGMRYEHVLSGDAYVYDGEAFRYLSSE